MVRYADSGDIPLPRSPVEFKFKREQGHVVIDRRLTAIDRVNKKSARTLSQVRISSNTTPSKHHAGGRDTATPL